MCAVRVEPCVCQPCYPPVLVGFVGDTLETLGKIPFSSVVSYIILHLLGAEVIGAVAD